MARVAIPDSVYFRNWKKSTDSLRNHLTQKLATVKERADAKRREADEIERASVTIEAALALLDQLLPPKAGAAPPVVLPTARAWSRMYPACRRCGTTDTPHASHGYCRTCQAIPEIRQALVTLNGVPESVSA